MMEINEKIVPQKNNLYLLKSLYLIKKYFPVSNAFYFLLYFLKYLGIIANSRFIEMVTNKDSISLNKYLKNIFLFGKDFSVMHKNYIAVCISGALILLLFYVYTGFCLFYMKYKYKDISSIIDEKAHGTNEHFEELIFKIFSYISMFVIFFHQYVLEYYCFGIYGFIYSQVGFTSKIGISKFYSNNLDKELIEYLDESNHTIILIINLIVIILILIKVVLFMLFNSVRGLFLKNGLFSGNMKYMILKLIMFNFQPLFVLNKFYNDEATIILGIIFNSIIIFFSLISFWNCFYQFGYYPNEIGNMCLYLEFFVFVSSIDEIIIYYVGFKETVMFFFVKIFIELINSYIIMRLFVFLKDRSNINIFAKNLFSKNSTDTSKGGLYHYIRIFLEYQKNKNMNYIKLFRILLEHVKYCKKVECPGQNLISKDYLKSSFIPLSYKEKPDSKNNIFVNREKLKEEKDDLNETNNTSTHSSENNNLKTNEKTKENNKGIEHFNINIEKKKLTEKQFQIIFEQEIMNKLEYLYKTKKIGDLEHFIFIHIQYLYKVKKNFALALYYLGKYSKCGIKWGFITDYYFYEYKTSIIQSYFNKLNINNSDKTVNKYRKDNLFMTEIINYFVLLALLKKLIISSCDKLKTLFIFRKNLHNPLILKTYKHSNTTKFFEKGEELKYNINKILHLTKTGLNQANKDNISAELSYIISNFLLITLNKIPEDLRKIINPNFDLNVISSKLESGYKFFNLVHPLILSLTKNNTFNINYFSCVISNRLGFHQHELKDKDFHEKLFPGVKFIKQHELLMKQFLFFSYNTYTKKNSFIKTKDGYLMGVSMTAKKFPTFYEDFFIIIGLDFNEKLFYSKLNKSFNRYSFLLDENMEFIAETKNFLEDFEFNIHMFKEIKTNFFEFFCVDKNRIMEKIKKKNKEIYKYNVNNVYNLKKEEDPFTIFKNISYEKAYELRDISKLENINNNFVCIYDKIEKDKIIRLIPEFSKLIEEYGLDFEWYQHLQNLTDRLTLRDFKSFVDNNLKNSINTLAMGQTVSGSLGFKNTLVASNSSTPNLNMKNRESKENLINNDSLGRPSYASISSASKKNFFNKVVRISLDKNFDVVYNLKRMGNIYYYIVDIYEKAIYLEDNNNGVKKKYSLNNKKIYEKNNHKLMTIKDESSKYVKAKTLFNDKLNIQKKFDFSPKVVLIDEEPNENKKDKKEIEKMKTWEKSQKEDQFNKEGEIPSIIINKVKSNIMNQEGKKTNLISRRVSKEGIILPRKSKKDLAINDDLNDKFDYYDQSPSYNYRNNKEQDDENVSLISKDQIEEMKKKNYYINRIYIIILITLFSISIVVISVKLYFASTNFTFILYLTSSLIYLEEIKADLYIGSIIVISQCLRNKTNDIPTGLNDIGFQLYIKGQDLMVQLNSFEKQINLINDNNLLSTIRQLLYKNITISHLNKDWSQKIESSYLVNEINYFSYLLITAFQNKNIVCDFDNNFFLLSSVKNSAEIYKISGQEISFNQKFIYYVLQNIIYDIQPVIVDILEQIMVSLIKKLDSYMNKMIVIYICMIILIIAIEVIFFLKNKSDIDFMRQIFIFLYNYENNDLKKEFEINYLENVAKEFNLNNLTLLEKIKKDNDFFYSLINSTSLLQLNENNRDDNINDKSLISNNKNGKNNNKEKQDENLINNYQNIKKDLEQNSMNGSLLNNSINNNSSMVQFLNKNNNKNIINDIKNVKKQTNKSKKGKKSKVMKNNDANKMKFKEEKIFKENEDVLELLKNNRKLVPLNTIISVYISIILSLLIIVTILISLFDLYEKRNTWEYAVNLSMNYLEKIPKIVELGFTAYLSAILGQFRAQFYSLNEYKSKQSLYLTYFTKQSGYDKSELIATNMNASYFMNKLYDNYRLKKNLEFCENDNSFSSHFKQTKFWVKQLDEKNNFCVNAALGSALFYNQILNTGTVFDYYTYVEQMAIHCREEGEKLDESGLDLEIDFILQELTYMFSDFEQQMKSNLTMARNAFFGNPNNLRILKDMNVPLSFASGALYTAVATDMKDLTNYISRFELIFIAITYIIDGLFILYIFWNIYLNEKDKNILVYITKIIQKE